MNERYSHIKELTVGDIKNLGPLDENLLYLAIEAVDSSRDLPFDITFIALKGTDSPPMIRIETKTRQEFLQMGTEQQVQDTLVARVLDIRNRTGGYIDIHPFYGAVWSTSLTHITSLGGPYPNDKLTMMIHLCDMGDQFDPSSEISAIASGNSLHIGPQTDQRDIDAFFEAFLGCKANPNQGHRNIASVNDLDQQWDAQNKQFNTPTPPPAIPLNHGSIAAVLGSMQHTMGFTDFRIQRINYQNISPVDLARLPDSIRDKVIQEPPLEF